MKKICANEGCSNEVNLYSKRIYCSDKCMREASSRRWNAKARSKRKSYTGKRLVCIDDVWLIEIVKDGKVVKTKEYKG